MEQMKELGEITSPDCRSTVFVKLDTRTGTAEPMIVQDYYRHVADIRLNEEVPEEVRSYMEAVKSLFAYGYFYYPFFTLAALLGTTALEMALRAKLPVARDDRRGMGALLKQATQQNLLGNAEATLAASLKHLRNTFAHPTGHWIMAPGQASGVLIAAGEMINRLWPPKVQKEQQ